MLAVGVGIGLVVPYRNQVRLMAENRRLRQRLAQVSPLAAENVRLSNLVARGRGLQIRGNDQLRELLRLRSELHDLRRKTNEVSSAQLAQAPAPSGPAETKDEQTEVIGRDVWAFSGYASPEAALQTVAWAMKNGDVQSYLASLTPDGFEFVEQQFQDKTEAELSASLVQEISGTKALRLDRKRQLDDGKVAFVIGSTEQDDGETKMKDEQLAVFKNVAGEWRLTGAPDE